MTPELKAKLLADFKAKKFTTASSLAKAHGLSRSAVYRVLKADSPVEVKAPEPKNQAPDDFFSRTEKFADDLGLPADGSRLRHNVEEQSPEQQAENEAEMEAAFDVITGSRTASQQIPDDVLGKIYGSSENERPPKRRYEDVYEPENPVLVEDLIQRIIFNVENFAPHLQAIIGTTPDHHRSFLANLNTRSPAELSGLLKTIERTRSVNNVAIGFKQVFYMFSQATEAGSSLIGLKTAGFTDSLRQQDAEVTMCLKEIAINEWERLRALDSPQLRLGMLFSMTLIQTDAKNRMNEQLQKVTAAPVGEDLNERYKSL